MEPQNNIALEDEDLDNYFLKRPGTTNWGVDYEILFIANLALNLTIKDNISDFKISTNVKEFEAFDDVVFQASTRNGSTESFALQLKHRRNGKTITTQQLQATYGDFSLQKYVKSYSSLRNSSDYKFALFTNDSISGTLQDSLYPIFFNGKYQLLKMIFANQTHSSILDIDKNCFQFIPVDTDDDPILRNFSNQFIFFTNQPNVYSLRHTSFRLYKQHFSSSYDHFHLYIHFIQQWMKLEKPNFLTKYSVPQMIALQILTPDLFPFSQNINDEDGETPKYNLIRRLTNEFNIVITKHDSHAFLHKCFTRYEIEDEEIKICKILNRYPIIVPSPTFEEIEDPISKAKLLWLLGKQPLVVKGTPTSYNAIKLCQRKKILVLDDSFQTENLDVPRLSIFWNLSSLSNNLDFLNQILENFITQEDTLKALLQIHPEIKDAITLHELIIMAESVVEAYEAKEVLPPAYKERTLTQNVIDFDFFSEHLDGTKILAIGCIEQLENIDNTLRDFDLLDIHQILKSLDKTKITEKTIFISREKCLPDHLEALMSRLNKPCHYFEIADQRLQWIYSTSPITELQDFQNFSYTSHQNDIKHYKNEIIVIFGQAGLGKSTLCRSLKNNLYSNLWKSIIAPEFFVKFLKKNGNSKDQVNLFLDTIAGRYNPLQKVVFNVLRAKKNLVLFWDEFDQLIESNGMVSIKMVKALAESGVKQFVFTRPTNTQFLEEQFNVLSRSLSLFTVAQSEQFIKDQLPDLDRTILRKVLREIKLNQNSNVFKVPLNISLLVEKILEREEQYLEIIKDFSMLTM